jgi:hypothetical protein
MLLRLTLLTLFVAAWDVPLALAEEAPRQETTRQLLPPDLPMEQVVDHYLDAALKEAKVQPVPLTDDATLIRRLTLDLNGRIPTVAETAAYLAAPDAGKKVPLVDRLMSLPAFVRHQAQEFFTFLQSQEELRRGKMSTGLHDYLRTAFAQNQGWDRMFRAMLLPDDNDPALRGAGDFLKTRVKDLNRLTIDTSIVFFGVNVSCA